MNRLPGLACRSHILSGSAPGRATYGLRVYEVVIRGRSWRRWCRWRRNAANKIPADSLQGGEIILSRFFMDVFRDGRIHDADVLPTRLFIGFPVTRLVAVTTVGRDT